MGSNFESLVFEIIAKDAQANAAFDRFRNSVDKTSGSVDKNSKALDDNTKALEKSKQSHVSWLGVLAGGAAAFAPITAGAAAAGAGIAAFGALAIPSVKKVSAALTAKGGLADSWVTLDSRQRNAALGIQALGQDYQVLAKRMEPQVFQVFNQGLTLAHSLLGPTGELARTSGQGISDFLATFSADSGLQHFIAYLSTIARPAIGLVGQDVTSVSHAVFSLLQSFGGAGLLELRALTGVFTALDDSVSFLSQHAPGLTSAGLAIGGIALALSKLGLLSGALKITGISSIAGQMAGFTAATRGATVAEKGLLATTTALDAVTPWGWAALGVGALGAVFLALRNVNSGMHDIVMQMAVQDHAAGFNIAGWQKLAQGLGQAAQAQENLRQKTVLFGPALEHSLEIQTSFTGSQENTSKSVRTLISFLGVLQARYGITRDQAASLADSSKVLIDKQGHLVLTFGASVAKAEAFGNANVTAAAQVNQLRTDMQDTANATLTLTDRTKALTAALNVFFNPAVTADQALITLAGDAQTAAKALAAAGGRTQGLTGVQGAARSAFDTYISQVGQTASQVFAATGRTGDYNRIIDANIPRLERMAGANRVLRGEIQDLVNTLKGVRSENVRITVGATGSWNVIQGAGGGQIHAPGAAAGMMVRGGVPGRDSVLIRAMPGELVVPQHLVSRGAVDHLRGKIPGFADGGVVGAYHGTPPGLGRFLVTEDARTLLAIENAVARATLAGIHAAAAKAAAGAPPGSSGTAVGAVQQWARAHLSDYGWGPGQFPPLQALWNQESGWRWNAANPSSGAYGIPQSLPASKMASAGADWRTNPVTQMRWGLGYIRAVYGSPAAAEGHELAFHWYDQGGYLPPGPSLAFNGTGRPERVGGGDTIINVTVQVGHGTNPRQAAKEIADILNQGAAAGIRLRKSILSANG